MTWLAVLVVVGGCAAQVSEQRFRASLADAESISGVPDATMAREKAERARDDWAAQCAAGPPTDVTDPRGWAEGCTMALGWLREKADIAADRESRAKMRALDYMQASQPPPSVPIAIAPVDAFSRPPRSAPPAPAPLPPAPLKLECRPNPYGGGSTCIERQPFTLPPIAMPQ